MSFAIKTVLALACMMLSAAADAAERPRPNNVILFVPSGLRALAVTPETAPAMAALRDKGVHFKNPHSLFPTVSMTNASALATGHYLGDTGAYGNTIQVGIPIAAANGSTLVPLENNAVLGEIGARFGGSFLNEDTILKAARLRGWSTAAIGASGPVLLFDPTERGGGETIMVDDQTGASGGIPVVGSVKDAMAAAGLAPTPPARGGDKEANAQLNYFTDIAAKVVLPLFKSREKPFLLVFWSTDPSGALLHPADSHDELVSGTDGPASSAATKHADDALARLQRALAELGLADTTNIIVAADHGVVTASRESSTSSAAKADYPGVPKGQLPRLPGHRPGQGARSPPLRS